MLCEKGIIKNVDFRSVLKVIAADEPKGIVLIECPAVVHNFKDDVL